MKKKEYYIMREDDLLIIGKVKLNEKHLTWIERIPFLKFSAVALLFAIPIIVLWLSVSGATKVSKAIDERDACVAQAEYERDSCISQYNEIMRSDKFSVICAEVFCSAKCESCTHDNIWAFIQECDPWYPDVIMMQAVIESGCGKSVVAKRCNNLFGMKKPESRELRCDINRWNKRETYAEYQNWKTSVIDRILWERWMFKDRKTKPTINEYLNMLDKVYNKEVEGYAKGIHKQAAKYRKNKK